MAELKEKMDGFSLEQEYIYPVMALYHLTQQVYKKFFGDKKFNITPSQWEALNQLWDKDGMSQAELADRTFKDRPFTTRLVDDLEKKALVYRVQDKKDRRSNKVFLTAKGRTLKFQILPEYFKLSDQLRGSVSPEAIEELKETCRELSDTIRSIS